VAKHLTVKLAGRSDQRAAQYTLVKPNPGDMMMALVFGWGLFCFFLITVGDTLLVRIASLARNQEYRDLLLEGDQVLGALMIGGSVVLVLAVYVFHNYPRFFLGSLVFSFTFANASWPPLHDVAFAMKYLASVFLGIYTLFYVYPNFWRIAGTPYVRLFLAFTAWVVAVCFLVGGRLEDIWYGGTVVCFALGFAVFFVYEFNNKYGLDEFFNVLCWGAALTVLMHMTAPFLSEEYIQNGRFQSFFIRATAFGVTLSPLVVILFWRAMTDVDPQRRAFFILVSLAGMALLLWSGSRSPIAATLFGGGLLWLRFRSKLFLTMFIFAALGVAIQLLFQIGSAVDTEEISSRLSNAETGRVELWIDYFEVAIKSPLYGYAPSGLGFALAGADIGAFLGGLGITDVDYESVHNAYLAVFMRFGGVGFGLFISLLGFAFYRAKQVLSSPKIPAEEKSIIILPATLLLTVCFTLIFEDSVPGTGKGTLESFILFSSMFICQVYGTRLLNTYDRADSKYSEIPTLHSMRIADQQRSSIS
jgi:hypothetical protein